MKIASIYYGTHKKGCWKRLVYFLKALLADGHEITLITSQSLLDVEEHKNLKSIVIPSGKIGKISLLWFIFSSSLTLFFRFGSNGFNRFIAFDCHNAVPFFFCKIFSKIPLFLFVRGFYRYQDLFFSKSWFGKKIFKYINKVGYNLADRVCYTSEANKNDMIQEFGQPRKRIRVVRNNILNYEIYNDVITRKNASRNIDAFIKNTIVGYLGQISPRKNIKFLIDAVQLCLCKNIHLLIQGEGEDKTSLKQYIENKGIQSQVTFLDWQRDINGFFSEIDIFVLPSYYDDASNSLIEAIFAEKIVFASNRGGNPELLKNRKDLLFCPLNGKDDLSQKIDYAIEDAGYREEILNHIKKCKDDLIFDWVSEMKNASLLRSDTKSVG